VFEGFLSSKSKYSHRKSRLVTPGHACQTMNLRIGIQDGQKARTPDQTNC
jgi:hypothetical protein